MLITPEPHAPTHQPMETHGKCLNAPFPPQSELMMMKPNVHFPAELLPPAKRGSKRSPGASAAGPSAQPHLKRLRRNREEDSALAAQIFAEEMVEEGEEGEEGEEEGRRRGEEEGGNETEGGSTEEEEEEELLDGFGDGFEDGFEDGDDDPDSGGDDEPTY